MLARHAELRQVQSAWVVSWAADCLFEKVELLSLLLHHPPPPHLTVFPSTWRRDA